MNYFKLLSYCLGLFVLICGVASGESAEEFTKSVVPLQKELQQIRANLPAEEFLEQIPAKPWRNYAGEILQKARRQCDELEVAMSKAPPKLKGDELKYACTLRDTGIRPLKAAVKNLKKLVSVNDPLLLFIKDEPITNYRVIKSTKLIDGIIGDTISIFASPGEYEPASFVLLSTQATKVTFETTDLRSGENTIPNSALDLKLVKVWYQAGKRHWDLNNPVLTPELLINDDDLVKLNNGTKRNFVRNMENPKDTASLLPVRLKANQPRQFWLTVHTPLDVKPGEYSGRIVIHANGLGDKTLQLKLHVLPIELQQADMHYGVYYRAYLSPNKPRHVSSELKTPQQLEAEFRNMRAHGILYPDVYQYVIILPNGERDHKYKAEANFEYLDKYLQIKKRAGLPLNPMYFLGVGTGSFTEKKDIEKRLDLIRKVLAFAKDRGITEVYFQGSDEAHGEALSRQRKMWEAIHGVGGKIFVACYKGFYDRVGDLLDQPIISMESPKDLKKLQARGGKMFNYNKPQACVEEPYTYRYYFGHWLARTGMKGSHTYAYQHGAGTGDVMGHMWNDFDGTNYRSFGFTYPTVDGVVNTIQFEGVREAVDDVRYLTTLKKAIEAAKKSGDPKLVAMANESEQWLLSVDIKGDLQAIRWQMARRIMALTNDNRLKSMLHNNS